MRYNNRATDVLPKRPTCDLCKLQPAEVDGKTKMGPWGYMCDSCYGGYGTGLGMGVGQVLLCHDGLDELLIKKYELEEEPNEACEA